MISIVNFSQEIGKNQTCLEFNTYIRYVLKIGHKNCSKYYDKLYSVTFISSYLRFLLSLINKTLNYWTILSTIQIILKLIKII